MLDRALAQYDQLLDPHGATTAYHHQIRGRRQLIERAGKAAGPQRAAAAVKRAVDARRPKAHYYIGWNARAPAIIKRLPARLSDTVLRRAVKSSR